jgi:hypothetical protein
MLDDIYKENNYLNCDITTYQWRQYNYNPDSKYNMVIITDNLNVSGLELTYLDSIVKDGNNVFIAASSFGEDFEELLGLRFNYYNPFSYYFADTLNLELVNPNLKDSQSYAFVYSITFSGFEAKDSLAFSVIGLNHNKTPNFIRIKRGKGNFYLHSQPFAFTNVNILDSNNYRYIQNCISFLPKENLIVWNEFYKPFKLEGSQSLLKVVNYYKPLRYATYLFFTLVMIYLFFGSKRKQKPIPVIKPPVNTSLEFIDTISRVYLYDKNHKKMAKTKYNYFLDYVKSKYHVDTSRTGEQFEEILAEKSGVEKEVIGKILQQERNLRSKHNISSEELISFNNTIEEFYKKSV